MQRTQVPFLGREDILEKDTATHALILALEIPRSEELRAVHGGHKRVGHNLATKQQQERQHSCLAVLASTAEKNESAIHTHISPPFWVWVSLPLVPVSTFLLLLLMILMYLFLPVLGLRCSKGFSRVVASGGYALVPVFRLLIGVASLAVGHSLCKHRLGTGAAQA